MWEPKTNIKIKSQLIENGLQTVFRDAKIQIDQDTKIKIQIDKKRISKKMTSSEIQIFF